MEIIITLSIAASLVCQLVSAQTHTEKINKEYAFEKTGLNAVMIANINGDVEVVSYEGSTVLVEVTKTIKAKTEARLEKGKQVIQVGLIDRADTLIFFVEGTCSTFSKINKKKKGDGRWMRGWNYTWNDCDGNNCREQFDYTMDFKVKVPASVNLMVSTINDGDIVVENVKGSVHASNVNGS